MVAVKGAGGWWIQTAEKYISIRICARAALNYPISYSQHLEYKRAMFSQDDTQFIAVMSVYVWQLFFWIFSGFFLTNIITLYLRRIRQLHNSWNGTGRAAACYHLSVING